MKTRLSPKLVSYLSLGATLVVLIAVVAYLGAAGRAARSAARRAPASSAPHSVALLPPATPAGIAPAPQTPSAALASATAPSPASKPAGAPNNAPGSPQSPAASPAQAPPDPEAAVVGAGPRGRNDPFSPLVILESQRAAPGPPLPPPPGVGLPMPPGFAAPGTPGAPGTPAPAPGAGMRVTGIMGSRQRVAIIDVKGQTYIVAAGERVGDAVVVSILSDKVVLKQNNVTFELGFGGDRSL